MRRERPAILVEHQRTSRIAFKHRHVKWCFEPLFITRVSQHRRRRGLPLQWNIFCNCRNVGAWIATWDSNKSLRECAFSCGLRMGLQRLVVLQNAA